MKSKRIVAAALMAAALSLFQATPMALAEESPPGEDALVIEVPVIDAEPGDIIDIPIMITSNPGVSVIKDLRIDLGRGLTLYFPQGEEAYINNGTAATWPYAPEKESHGQNTGMLPVMGRPSAANIGERHIVLNFLDVTRPFDSTETGTLITLKAQVSDEVSGDIPVRITGGTYGNMARDGDKEPALVQGTVSTGGDAGSASGGTQEQDTEDSNSSAAPAQIPDGVITAALQDEAPQIKLTPEMGTVITEEMIQEIIAAGKPVTFELADGTVVEINPAHIPEGTVSLDLEDLPQEMTDAANERNSPFVAVVPVAAGVAVLGAAAAVYYRKKRKSAT